MSDGFASPTTATGDSAGPLLARRELAGAVEAVLHRGGWGNPDVLLVRHGDGRIVVKDYAPRHAWVAASLGRWLIARERRAYQRLRGAPGVPRLLGQMDALALLIEYRPGQRLSRELTGRLPDDFMPELERSVQAMHRRGVVHLDLRHRGNILAGDDGRPVLLDFASALRLPASWAPGRWLVALLAVIDRRALGKWRSRLLP